MRNNEYVFRPAQGRSTIYATDKDAAAREYARRWSIDGVETLDDLLVAIKRAGSTIAVLENSREIASVK